MAETSCEGRKPNDSSYQGKPGINAEKFQASILENQTVVAYTVEKLASFGDKVISKNTKKVQLHPYAVCSHGSSKNTANELISMQFRSKKHRSF